MKLHRNEFLFFQDELTLHALNKISLELPLSHAPVTMTVFRMEML